MPKKRARRSDSKELQKTKRSKSKASPNATHFNFNNSDDEILSESSDEELRVEGSGSGGMKGDDFFLNDGVDDDARETAQEKRIRLAKSLLNKVRDEEDVGSDVNVDEAVADRLHSKALDMAGRLTRNVAVVFAEKMRKIEKFESSFFGVTMQPLLPLHLEKATTHSGQHPKTVL